MPNVGYFVADKFAIGMKVNSQFTKYIDPNPTAQNKLGTGPFIRYYFLKFDNRVNLFSDASILYSVVSRNNGTGVIDDKQKSVDYLLSAGTVIFFNSSVGLEVVLAYEKSKALHFDAIAHNMQLRIGFQIHLEKQ